jgi:hypothetical protein
MSRRTSLFRRKATQASRKGLIPADVIFPTQTVKGTGRTQIVKKSVDEKGNVSLSRQPGRKTDAIVSLPMKTDKMLRLQQAIR